MNSAAIQSAIFDQFGAQSALVVPNYTPMGWYECDVLRVTKAGFADEYEIKVSVADFKADAKKGPDQHQRDIYAAATRERQAKMEIRTKHERLAAGDPKGPCRFWFAVPEDLAPHLEIPAWAGLVFFRRGYGGILRMSTAKKAPTLHRERIEPAVIEHARGVFYWRFWNLRRGMNKEAAAS